MAMMHSTCAIYVALLALSLTAMSPGRDSAGVEPAADGATAPIISTQYNPCSGGSCR